MIYMMFGSIEHHLANLQIYYKTKKDLNSQHARYQLHLLFEESLLDSLHNYLKKFRLEKWLLIFKSFPIPEIF